LGHREEIRLADTTVSQERGNLYHRVSKRFFTWSRPDRIAIIILAFLILCYITFFSAYQIQRHRAFETNLDTLSVEQPLWNTLHGQFMRTTYYPITGAFVTNFNDRKTDILFGDHVQPSLLVLLIPYAILPRTETLLVLLCICVGLGAIPLYWIAQHRLESPWLALLFAAAYLFLPAIETNTGWDIHGANFLPPLLLFALYAAETNHDKTWWFITLLAMGFREDFPIFVGWAMIWMVPHRLRRQACLLFGLGLVFSLVSFLVIIPHFGGGGTPYIERFLPSGTLLTPQGIWSAISQPNFWWLELVKIAVYNLRLGYPLLFLYFASNSALMAMAPLIVANGLSWYPPNLIPETFHYSSPLIAWAIIGAVDGFIRITHYLKQHRLRLNWNVVFGIALTTSILISHRMQGYTPLSKEFVWPDVTGRENIAQEMIASIPNKAAVSVEPHLAGHFSQFKTVYLFPDVRDAQWMMLDVWYGIYSVYLSAENTQALWNTIQADPSWETVQARDGLILLKKGSGPPENISNAYLLTQEIPPEFTVRFGDKNGMDLVNVSLVHHSKVEVTLCIDWELKQSEADMSPMISFRSYENILSQPPADKFSLSSQIFSQPGRYRICSRRIGTSYFADQQAVLISLATNGTNSTPVSISDPGKWASYLSINQDKLEVNLSGLR
jgi:uncharacterized membrane protein